MKNQYLLILVERDPQVSYIETSSISEFDIHSKALTLISEFYESFLPHVPLVIFQVKLVVFKSWIDKEREHQNFVISYLFRPEKYVLLLAHT